MNDEWILWVASHYHYRDTEHFADGSFGSFSITHNQFKRELAEAYGRGQESDTSVPTIECPLDEWRKRQGKLPNPFK